MSEILSFQEWKLNEELSDKEKKIFALWKKTWQLSQKKVSGESAKEALKNKISEINDQIKLLIGKDKELKEFFKDIKERLSLNKKQNSLSALKNKENKTAEDYAKIRELKAQIKELRYDDPE